MPLPAPRSSRAPRRWGSTSPNSSANADPARGTRLINDVRIRGQGQNRACPTRNVDLVQVLSRSGTDSGPIHLNDLHHAELFVVHHMAVHHEAAGKVEKAGAEGHAAILWHYHRVVPIPLGEKRAEGCPIQEETTARQRPRLNRRRVNRLHLES